MAYGLRSNQQKISDCDWGSAESVAQCVHELVRDNTYKERAERLAIRNESFLFGDQWYKWDKTENRMVPRVDKPGWQTRLVFNEILVDVEARIAKLMRDRRVWEPITPTDDLEDKVSQRLQSKVMEWAWTDGLKMNKKMRTILQWAMSSAVVFGHVYWDRNKGPMIETRLQDWLYGADTIADPIARQEFIREQSNRFFQLFGIDALNAGVFSGPSGDVCFDVAPIFEVGWWPFNITEWSQARIMYRRVKKPVEEVADMLGITNAEVRELAGHQGRDAPDQSRWQSKYFFQQEHEDDSVLVTTVWKLPTKKWPKGRQAFVIGNAQKTYFDPTDLQNYLNDFPIFPLNEKPIRGKVLGTNTVDQLRPAQEHINSTMSWAADYMATRVSPTLVDYSVNSQNPNNNGALSNKPGKVYEANSPNHVPTAIKMPDVPTDVFLSADNARGWMSKISGVASIDTGTTEDANIRSGRGLIQLREMNDLQMIPFGQEVDEFVSKGGNLTLSFYMNNVRTERVIQLTGEDGRRMELVKFRGKDLKPRSIGTPDYAKNLIKCRAFSTIPKSAAELSGFINTALTAATPDGRTLLDPTTDRNEIFDALGMQDLRFKFDAARLDTVKQQEEIEMWEAGNTMVAPPSVEDDDSVHIKMIEKWKKTDGYRIAAFQNPMVALSVDQHLQQHKTNMARKLIEPNYSAKRADVSLWMQNRAELQAELAQANPELAQEITDLMFPVPMLATPMAPPDGGQQQQQGGSDSKPNKPKPKKGDGAAFQGVSNEEKKT